MAQVGDLYYRFQDALRPSDEPFATSDTTIELEEFRVIRTTPKGVWLAHHDLWPHDPDVKTGETFVLNGTGRRFAHPTRELALQSFIARKQRQIKILRQQLTRAETALRLARRGEELGDLFTVRKAP